MPGFLQEVSSDIHAGLSAKGAVRLSQKHDLIISLNNFGSVKWGFFHLKSITSAGISQDTSGCPQNWERRVRFRKTLGIWTADTML